MQSLDSCLFSALLLATVTVASWRQSRIRCVELDGARSRSASDLSTPAMARSKSAPGQSSQSLSKDRLKPAGLSFLPSCDARTVARLLRRIDDTGAFFGLDIGGSLVKLVFFEPRAQLRDSSPVHSPRPSAGLSGAPMQRAASDMPPVARTAGGSPSDSYPESPQNGGVSSIAQFLKSR